MVLSRFFTLLIRGYQLILSPLLGQNCRFQPTCSDYAQEAIKIHGPGKGGLMAVRRILRCNPLTRLDGGWAYDPVPLHADCAHGCGPQDKEINGAVE